MSKSLGNVVAPQKVADSLGAEIIRMWVGATDYSGELYISDEILKRVVESYRRIRNTLRFLLANTADFDAGKDLLPVAEWVEIDRYALAMTRRMAQACMTDYDKFEFHFVAQKLQTFCSEDLGGFYLDILKDRLYTCGADSRARRSAQTALWHIAQSLVRLMAPILSFTAEEAWQVLAGGKGHSVFEEIWHVLPDPALDQGTLDAWGFIRLFREIATKKIEEKRETKAIGSSLAAELDIHASGTTYDALARLGDELHFVLITSRATVHQGSIDVKVQASAHPKCERCWHYRADVSASGLCGRCENNLNGPGETRLHA